MVVLNYSRYTGSTERLSFPRRRTAGPAPAASEFIINDYGS